MALVGQPVLAVGQAAGPYPLAWIRALVLRLVLQSGHLAEAALHDRQHERVDVGEVQVDRRRGDACLAGDAAQGQGRGGRICHQAAGRLDDVVAQPLALATRVPLPDGRLIRGHRGLLHLRLHPLRYG